MDPFISLSRSNVRAMIAARLEELFTSQASRRDPEFTIRFLSSNFSIPEPLVKSVLNGGTDLDPGRIREIQRVIDNRLSSEPGQETAAMLGWNGLARCLSASFFGPAAQWDPELQRILGDHMTVKKPQGKTIPAPDPRPKEAPKANANPVVKPVAKGSRKRPAAARPQAPKPVPVETRPAEPVPPPVRPPEPQLLQPRATEPSSEAAGEVTHLERQYPTRDLRERALEAWNSACGNPSMCFGIESTGFLLARAVESDPEQVINWFKACGRLDVSTSLRVQAALNR